MMDDAYLEKDNGFVGNGHTALGGMIGVVETYANDFFWIVDGRMNSDICWGNGWLPFFDHSFCPGNGVITRFEKFFHGGGNRRIGSTEIK